MGKQLELFPAPPPDANDRLNAGQAELRRERAAREATRPPYRPRVRFTKWRPAPREGA